MDAQATLKCLRVRAPNLRRPVANRSVGQCHGVAIGRAIRKGPGELLVPDKHEEYPHVSDT